MPDLIWRRTSELAEKATLQDYTLFIAVRRKCGMSPTLVFWELRRGPVLVQAYGNGATIERAKELVEAAARERIAATAEKANHG